jgi:hypothetical protein
MDKAVLRPQRGAKSEWRRARELSEQFNGHAKPHGREGAIGRRPSWPRKCQARGLGRHRLSGREHILAEMLHQRGNRAVTNNSCSSELMPMPILRDNPTHERRKSYVRLKSVQAENCLEPISKLPEEDNEAGELNKAEEVLSVELPADEYAALPLYPGEETLDELASHIAAQPSSILRRRLDAIGAVWRDHFNTISS